MSVSMSFEGGPLSRIRITRGNDFIAPPKLEFSLGLWMCHSATEIEMIIRQTDAGQKRPRDWYMGERYVYRRIKRSDKAAEPAYRFQSVRIFCRCVCATENGHQCCHEAVSNSMFCIEHRHSKFRRLIGRGVHEAVFNALENIAGTWRDHRYTADIKESMWALSGLQAHASEHLLMAHAKLSAA